MKRFFLTATLFVLSVLTILACASTSFAQVRQTKVVSSATQLANNDEPLLPAPSGFVNDFADVIDLQTREQLEQTLVMFKEQQQVDLFVVTVITTGDKTTFAYSLAVARDWATKAKNPNQAKVLVLIAVKDRKWQIQVTRLLEKVLSNEEMSDIGNLMNPSLRESNYGEGITKCVNEFIKVITEKRELFLELSIIFLTL